MSDDPTNTPSSGDVPQDGGVPASNNQSTKLDLTTQQDPPQSTDFQSVIPEGYKDREYLKNIDSFDRLFQDFDNAQKLIGKKTIPSEDDPQEKWDDFYKALGRPDEHTAYEFEKLEGVNYNEDIANKTKEIFHKAGLTPKQAAMIQSEYDKMVQEFQPSSEEIDRQFDELASKAFGNEKDEALKKSKALIDKYVPEDFREHVGNLSNKDLVILSSVLNGVIKDHVSEDNIPGSGASSTGGEDLRTKARNLMASEAYRDAFHADHENVKRQVRELYKKIS